MLVLIFSLGSIFWKSRNFRDYPQKSGLWPVIWMTELDHVVAVCLKVRCADVFYDERCDQMCHSYRIFVPHDFMSCVKAVLKFETTLHKMGLCQHQSKCWFRAKFYVGFMWDLCCMSALILSHWSGAFMYITAPITCALSLSQYAFSRSEWCVDLVWFIWISPVIFSVNPILSRTYPNLVRFTDILRTLSKCRFTVDKCQNSAIIDAETRIS